MHHEAPEVELVSRPLQSTAGLGTGTLIYGVALGGMFALVFAAAYGRLGPLAARGTAALLGCLGFTAVYLVPFLKYPANPPSIGDPDTIQYRTALYLVLVLVSVVAMVFAVHAAAAARRTLRRLERHADRRRRLHGGHRRCATRCSRASTRCRSRRCRR